MRLATGLGVALAVSFPPVVVGLLLVAVDDDPLPPAVRAGLIVAVLAGPVAGGAAIAGDRAPLLRAAAGSLAVAIITGFGIARRTAADDDPATTSLLLSAVLIGALLGLVGGGLRSVATGRTRR